MRPLFVPFDPSMWGDDEDEQDIDGDKSQHSSGVTENPAELAKLAKKLDSHLAFINLLKDSFKAQWPADDKGVDKKPSGGYARPKSAVPSDTAHTGDKRRSMDDGPEDKARRSKRSKT